MLAVYFSDRAILAIGSVSGTAHMVPTVGSFTTPSPLMIYPLSHLSVGLLQTGPGRQRARLHGALLVEARRGDAVVPPWFACPPGANTSFPVSFCCWEDCGEDDPTRVATRVSPPGIALGASPAPLLFHGERRQAPLPSSSIFSCPPLCPNLPHVLFSQP
jgi:hypothetical protein